ncbi:hypothetical protein [Sorangium sp. So ce1389]|uniref:hypothetical protein n=1 Tax=Sorangium sp. So ce1389 TaxID=3133336 RepID=UPI003F5EF6CA
MANSEITTHAFRVLNADGSVFGKGSFTYEGPSSGVSIAYAAGAAASKGPKLTAFSYRDPVVGTMDLSNVLTLNFANGAGATPHFALNLGDPLENARGFVAGTASPGQYGAVSTHRGVGGGLCCQGKKLEFPGGLSLDPEYAEYAESIPAVDLVVVTDTSSSMLDEAENLNKTVSAAVAAAQGSCPSDLRVTYLGIEGTFKNTRFDTSVRAYLTQKAQVDPSQLRGRTAETAGVTASDAAGFREDGARAIEDIANHFNWRPGAARAIFYLGDEPLEGGLGVGGTGQDQEDIEAATRAIEAAKKAGARVHTYMGTAKLSEQARKAISGEYARVAQETGGQFFASQDELSAFQAMLEKVIRGSNPRGRVFDGATTPWLYDIGKGIGKYETDGQTITFKATGMPFRGATGDDFSYLATRLLNDGAITVRVKGKTGDNGDSTVGVQIRDTLDRGSPYVMIHWEYDGWVHCSWRSATDGAAQFEYPLNVQLPVWLRIERKGEEFITSICKDEKGEKFEEVKRLTLGMDSNVYIGVALTSNEKKAATALIDRCSVTTPQGSGEAPSLSSWFGAPGVPELHDIGRGIGKWEWDGHKITFRAVGTQLYGLSTDDASFLAVPFTGDAQLTVRVVRFDNTHGDARVGVQIREDFDKGSRYAMTAWEPTNTVFHYREQDDEASNYPYIASPKLPVWLRILRRGDVFTSSYSTDGEKFTQLSTPATVAMSQRAYAGIVLSSLATVATTAVIDRYSLELLPDASGQAPSVGNFFEGKDAPKLHDIGKGLGKWERDGDRIRFKASGTQLYWMTEDDFSFLAVPFTGDGQLTLRVLGLENTDGDARVGVMVRQSLDPVSRYAMMAYEPTHTIFHSRAQDKAQTAHEIIASPKTPVWLRIVRAGSTFTGLYSLDGKTFTRVGSPQKVEMTGQVQIGIALTSNAMKSNTALFDQVNLVTGTISDPLR